MLVNSRSNKVVNIASTKMMKRFFDGKYVIRTITVPVSLQA
jgi:hypothetical protein